MYIYIYIYSSYCYHLVLTVTACSYHHSNPFGSFFDPVVDMSSSFSASTENGAYYAAQLDAPGGFDPFTVMGVPVGDRRLTAHGVYLFFRQRVITPFFDLVISRP